MFWHPWTNLSPSRPLSGSLLSLSVSCINDWSTLQCCSPGPHLEYLPAQRALAAHQQPGQLPEARGGHVAPPDGEGAPVAQGDVALAQPSSVKLCSVWSNHIWLFWPPSPLSRTCPWLMVASSVELAELHHTVLSKLLRQCLNSNRVCLWENTTNTIYGLKLGFYVPRIWIWILTLVWV